MTTPDAPGSAGQPEHGVLLTRMTRDALARLLTSAACSVTGPWDRPLSALDHRSALLDLSSVLRDLRVMTTALAARYRYLATARPAPGPVIAATGATAAAQLLSQAHLTADGLLAPAESAGVVRASIPADLLCYLARHLAASVLPAEDARGLAVISHALAAAVRPVSAGTHWLAVVAGPDAGRLTAVGASMDAAAARLPAPSPRHQPGPGQCGDSGARPAGLAPLPAVLRACHCPILDPAGPAPLARAPGGRAARLPVPAPRTPPPGEGWSGTGA